MLRKWAVRNGIVGVALFCLLVASCGSDKKTGTVKGLVFDEKTREMLARVILDDGKDVLTFPKVYSTPEGGGTKWELVKMGQRVEIEQHKETNSSTEWKIVRIVMAAPEKWAGRIGTRHRDIEGGRSVHEVILEDGTKIEAEHDSPSEMLGWRTRVEVVEGGRYWKIVTILPPDREPPTQALPINSPF